MIVDEELGASRCVSGGPPWDASHVNNTTRLCLNPEVSPLCPPLEIHCMRAFLCLCVPLPHECFQYSRCLRCFAYEKHLITPSAVPCLPNAIENKHAGQLVAAAPDHHHHTTTVRTSLNTHDLYTTISSKLLAVSCVVGALGTLFIKF